MVPHGGRPTTEKRRRVRGATPGDGTAPCASQDVTCRRRPRFRSLKPRSIGGSSRPPCHELGVNVSGCVFAIQRRHVGGVSELLLCSPRARPIPIRRPHFGARESPLGVSDHGVGRRVPFLLPNRSHIPSHCYSPLSSGPRLRSLTDSSEDIGVPDTHGSYLLTPAVARCTSTKTEGGGGKSRIASRH
jgi:hypothetical protein